jgi:hypothetical protein
MDLKHNVCHRCFNRDHGNKTPFLMSADNEMDPGELPAHLPELTQVEEMIIARSHVQMLVYRYCGHQYSLLRLPVKGKKWDLSVPPYSPYKFSSEDLGS